VARAVASLGFNWDFAPVLDVNNNPANPVIAERSFSETRRVTRLAGAWMRGALRGGVACCVKHFPGHGDTHVDSHLDLPVVDKSRTELEAARVPAVRRAERRGAGDDDGAHRLPAARPEHPATLSRRMLGGCCASSGATTAS
jgi:beta-N-acetylhexosaminidase